MNKHFRFLAGKLSPLAGAAIVAITGALLIGAPTEARADSGPYFVTYPGYCNVKRLFVDFYGNLYGKEVGCSSSLGEPLAGVSNADGVRVARVNWSTGRGRKLPQWVMVILTRPLVAASHSPQPMQRPLATTSLILLAG